MSTPPEGLAARPWKMMGLEDAICFWGLLTGMSMVLSNWMISPLYKEVVSPISRL